MALKSTTFARGKTGIENPRSITNITSDYKRFMNIINSEAIRIMQGAADIILETTLPKVPVETGALRQSGVARTTKTSKGVVADVSFGGPNNPVTPTKNTRGMNWVDYAVLIHEDLSKERKTGEAKFLENGSIEAKPKVEEYIVTEFKKLGI